MAVAPAATSAQEMDAACEELARSVRALALEKERDRDKARATIAQEHEARAQNAERLAGVAARVSAGLSPSERVNDPKKSREEHAVRVSQFAPKVGDTRATSAWKN